VQPIQDKRSPAEAGPTTPLANGLLYFKLNCKLASIGRDCKRGACRVPRRVRGPPPLHLALPPPRLARRWAGICRWHFDASRAHSRRRQG